MEWMILPYRRYADFSGRSRRLEYWMFTLFQFLVVVALVIVGAAFFGRSDPVGGIADDEGGSGMILIVLVGLFLVVSIVPGIAVQVRRLHDQDKSGWLILLSFIPYIGGIILLVLMLIDGTPGANRYGPDPKGRFDVSPFT